MCVCASTFRGVDVLLRCNISVCLTVVPLDRRACLVSQARSWCRVPKPNTAKSGDFHIGRVCHDEVPLHTCAAATVVRRQARLLPAATNSALSALGAVLDPLIRPCPGPLLPAA